MARVYGPASARPEPTDRNPDTVNTGFNTDHGTASQALVTQFTYTTPAARKARAHGGICVVGNYSATVVNGRAFARINVIPDGGAGRDIVRAEIATGQGPVVDKALLGSSVDLLAGDALQGQEQVDNNAGGTDVETLCQITILEYDA